MGLVVISSNNKTMMDYIIDYIVHTSRVLCLAWVAMYKPCFPFFISSSLPSDSMAFSVFILSLQHAISTHEHTHADQSFHATNINFWERDHRTTVESTTASVGLAQARPNNLSMTRHVYMHGEKSIWTARRITCLGWSSNWKSSRSKQS